MSFNLIDAVKSLLPGDLLNKAAGMLGESSSNVQQAVSGIIPSIFAGVLNKAGSGDVHGILNMAVDAAKNGIPENLTSLIGSGEAASIGSNILRNLFGDRAAGIANAVAGFSGVSAKSASSLLNVAAPAAMGVLGKHITDNNLNTGGLLSFLNSQKDAILNAVPSGLNLSSVLGIGSLSAIGSKLSSAVSGIGQTASKLGSEASAATAKAASGSRWLLPVLVGLVLLLVIWYFLKRSNRESTTPVMSDSVAVVSDSTAAPAPVAAGPEQIKVKLPDGTELNAYKGGIEDQLVNFLNDPNSKPGKDVWFDFDNLNFKTNSSDITNESIDQVHNIAAILKAYPKVKIKIGGYTDRTGDSIQNKKLSQDRANTVAAAIKGAGAKASQVTGAEGYGSAFAKAAADAPDAERAKDRRISVSVRDK